MKKSKLLGLSALLLGVVLFASGCDKFSCGTNYCGPVAPTCAPNPCEVPVESCNPCGGF